METKNKFAFLTSTRFIQLVLVAILQALVLFNVINSDQSVGLIDIISKLFLGSVAIGTVDKFSQAKLAAATNTTVSIPSKVSSVSAKTTKKK